MILHYLKIAWRNLLKDRVYSAVNILGLAIAMTFCFLLIFWIRFELSYETGHPDVDRIYKILEEETRTDGINYNGWIRPGFSAKIKEVFPQVKYATYVSNEELPFTVAGGDTKSDGIMAMLVTTNEDYLKMFAYEYVEGSPEAVMKNRGAILSEELARKFFGKKSAIGEMLSFGSSGHATFMIGAVVKVPENTHLKFGILNPHVKNEGYGGVHYIKLADEFNMSSEFEEQVSAFLSTTRDTKNKLKLQALRDVHLHSPKEIADKTYGSMAQIWFFSVAVLLILLVAVINYVNTSIARAMSRVKEVGVRKVFGANRRQLIQRFLLEAFVISFVAIFISMVLVELFFPWFSQVMGHRIAFNFDLGTLLIALGTCIIVSLLSGGYAAFYLSAFNPITIMKGGMKTGSKEGLRKLLIGVQFFLSISVLIGALFFYKQINAIYNAETGVDRKNIVILNTMLWYDAEDFIQIIKKENPNIIDASIAMSAPYNSSYSYSGVSWTGGKESSKEMEFTQIFCDHNYANTFGLQVIQGEFIPPGLSWWQYSEEKSFNIVINEAFKKVIGLDNPIGVSVNYAWGMRGKIIGVVKDFNFKPLKEKIEPLIISFNPEVCNTLYIKTTGKDKKATLNYILDKYKEIRPNRNNLPIMYRTVDDEYNEMYETELRTAGMLSVFAVVSLLLALMGIVSMISFTVEKRSKEIAIRRINGARTRDIVQLFSKSILQVALVASIPAIPLCYYILSRWIQTYIYRTSLSWWLFLAIPLSIMGVTYLIISLQIHITAQKNPVDALKNE